MRGMQRKRIPAYPIPRTLGRGGIFALLLLGLSCSDGDTPTTPARDIVVPAPFFDIAAPANGLGQCLLDDVIDAGFINSADVNCTSEDVDVALANVSLYSTVSAAGPFVDPDDTGGKVQCTAGQTVWVQTSAQVINHAQERYDVGLWIGEAGANALTGGSCFHFNLVNDENNSTDIDGDDCGDVAANVTVDVPLGTLQLTCADGDPDPASTALIISACAAWQNHTDGDPRVCPTGEAPGPDGKANTGDEVSGFRPLTTPETPAKCKCEPLKLPLDIRGSITIVKNAIPDDVQDFAYTTTGTGLSNFSLDDDGDNANTLSNTKVFSNLAAGSYTVDEGELTGWLRTGLSCTGGGANTTWTLATGVATIVLDPGENVTCNYENTKLGSITIVKNAIPDDAQDFAYTTTGTGLSNFSLDDDGDNANTLSNTKVFSNLGAGSYTVDEGELTGWTRTGLTCTGGGGNTSWVLATGVATIGLEPGENVTCSYENTKLGSITIVKDAIPNDPQDFAYTTTGTGLSSFSLDDDGDNANTLSNTKVFSNLAAGTYTVDEGELVGWSRTGLTCTGGGANTSWVLATGVSTIGLDPGETVTCNYENTKGGSITIVKDAIPNDVQDFAYTTTGTGLSSFSLDDDGDNANTLSNTKVFSNLTPGAYTVDEGELTGWSRTGLTCTGGGANTTWVLATGVSTIGLDPGENVTCNYENTKLGSITIVKDAIPNDPQDFAYTTTGTGLSNFSLDDDGDNTNTLSNTQLFSNLGAGTYTVDEGEVAGWSRTALTCTGGGANTSWVLATGVSTIGLDPGENVTCNYENTKLGSITIVKNAIPDDVQDFAYTTTGTGLSAFNLDDDGDNANTLSNTKIFSDLLPGTRTVNEGELDGWDRTALSCTGGGANTSWVLATGVATIGLDAGENVTCNYENRKRASLTVNKVEDGGLPLSRAWTFEVRTGATTLAAGTVRATGAAVLATGVVNFSCSPNPNAFCVDVGGVANFVPSSDAAVVAAGGYQLCETGMPAGYSNNITGFTPLGGIPEGTADNSIECIDITLVSGGNGPSGLTGVPNPIDNVRPPGGDARTIGYWKNWSSCTGGNQYTKAVALGDWDRTLDGNLPQTVGLLTLAGAPAADQPSPDCLKAFDILNKSAINNHKKMASDPAYNMAAQLLAAMLNVEAGAALNCGITTTIAQAQALLVAISFDGTGSYKNSMTPAQISQANTLAGLLDDYNNNTCT